MAKLTALMSEDSSVSQNVFSQKTASKQVKNSDKLPIMMEENVNRNANSGVWEVLTKYSIVSGKINFLTTG